MLLLDHVTVRFGGLLALRDVSLRVGDGSDDSNTPIVGLVGANGAGKTTLFNAISGLATLSEGRIEFDGRSLRGLRQHARARLGIGRTFQIPQPLHRLTVRENLRVAQRYGAGRVDATKLDRILEATQLDLKAERDAATSLSLTELKALEVAKALATEPRLLLLDEVLAGLESSAKRRFSTLLVALREKFKLRILMIEHDIETIRTLCPRVVVLERGATIADGSPDAVFTDARVIESYTGATHA